MGSAVDVGGRRRTPGATLWAKDRDWGRLDRLFVYPGGFGFPGFSDDLTGGLKGPGEGSKGQS